MADATTDFGGQRSIQLSYGRVVASCIAGCEKRQSQAWWGFCAKSPKAEGQGFESLRARECRWCAEGGGSPYQPRHVCRVPADDRTVHRALDQGCAAKRL